MGEENREDREYRECHETKGQWCRTIGIILATLIGAFLAFYFAVDMTFNRMLNPDYQMKKMEKMMKHEQRSIERMERNMGNNPFEPKMAPMLVNLAKEQNEYKIIVDLKPFDNNDKNIDVKLADNMVTVSGKMAKKEHKREEIMNFSQSYYLDEKINAEKMSKEKAGDKYIITIPFED